MEHGDFVSIENRIGADHLVRRIAIESGYYKSRVVFGYWKIRFVTMRRILNALKFILKSTGVWEAGIRGALDYRVREQRVRLPNLPASFRGFRIIHISDLHIEAIPDNCERLKSVLHGLEADLCVITGDFRFDNFGGSENAVASTRDLISVIRAKEGVFGVLGNHDSIDMIPPLEKAGLRLLLNESVPLKRDGDMLWLCGVDDPHFFELHDLESAYKGIPSDAFKILLAHSADIAHAASERGTHLYLCGHSHGGQICLPGGIPLIANMRVARKFFRDYWTHGGMTGYTSHGTGASGLPVRYFSRPEIVIHELN